MLVGLVILGVLAPASAAYAEPSIEQIERQIRAESARLEHVVEEYNKVTEELKASHAAAAKLSATIKPLAAELTTASARLGELAALAYKGAALAEFSSVLTADDPGSMVDRLVTLDQITKYENDQLAAFTATKSRHDTEAAKLSALIAEQSAKRKILAERKRKIDADLARLYELRRQAYGRAQAAARSSGPTVAPPYVAGKAGVAVRYAYGALGKPYVWAADGPSGYDCSGLTLAAWRAAGVSLPHNAAMQWNALPKISRSALRPGDLVFYSGLGHVGIYVGNNQIIHSPTFGERVHVASVNIMTPYGYARPG
jgi:cell wall-associated NlpC family hydrolase